MPNCSAFPFGQIVDGRIYGRPAAPSLPVVIGQVPRIRDLLAVVKRNAVRLLEWVAAIQGSAVVVGHRARPRVQGKARVALRQIAGDPNHAFLREVVRVIGIPRIPPGHPPDDGIQVSKRVPGRLPREVLAA